MRIVVYGAGGIGGVLGGRLAHAGMDVTFIARGTHLEALRRRGLRIEAPTGGFVTHVAATDEPAEVGVADVILVCVKAWDVNAAIEPIRTMLGPETSVIPLQNWIEAPAVLAAALGRERVMGGTFHGRSRLVEPGVVRSDGEAVRVTFGELGGGRTGGSRGLERLQADRAGVRFERCRDIRKRMWTKFASVSSLGALGALSGVSLGQWRRDPDRRDLYTRLVREACAVARADGVPLGWWASFRISRWIATGPPEHRSSMQMDREAGRRSELPYQLGTIVRLGRSLGVPVPTSTEIHDRLLATETQSGIIRP